MERSSKELKLAWAGSLIFHLLIAILLFFTYTAGKLPDVQFVEMTWGMASSTANDFPQAALESAAASEGNEKISAEASSMVELPSRKNLEMPEEIINVPQRQKLGPNESPIPSTRATKQSVSDNREPVAKIAGSERKEKTAGLTSADKSTNVTAPYTAGSGGGSIGKNISFAIQWKGGGTRELLHGDLPKYPPGINIEAQIKLKVIVTPAGLVKSAQPVQKGNTRLENVSLKEIRLWKFDPLQSAQPQVDQECRITFNFKLK
jgi:outer membrane biosynthesis protein TonB